MNTVVVQEEAHFVMASMHGSELCPPANSIHPPHPNVQGDIIPVKYVPPPCTCESCPLLPISTTLKCMRMPIALHEHAPGVFDVNTNSILTVWKNTTLHFFLNGSIHAPTTMPCCLRIYLQATAK